LHGCTFFEIASQKDTCLHMKSWYEKNRNQQHSQPQPSYAKRYRIDPQIISIR
jgi:hypothetical protein